MQGIYLPIFHMDGINPKRCLTKFKGVKKGFVHDLNQWMKVAI